MRAADARSQYTAPVAFARHTAWGLKTQPTFASDVPRFAGSPTGRVRR